MYALVDFSRGKGGDGGKDQKMVLTKRKSSALRTSLQRAIGSLIPSTSTSIALFVRLAHYPPRLLYLHLSSESSRSVPTPYSLAARKCLPVPGSCALLPLLPLLADEYTNFVAGPPPSSAIVDRPRDSMSIDHFQVLDYLL